MSKIKAGRSLECGLMALQEINTSRSSLSVLNMPAASCFSEFPAGSACEGCRSGLHNSLRRGKIKRSGRVIVATDTGPLQITLVWGQSCGTLAAVIWRTIPIIRGEEICLIWPCLLSFSLLGSYFSQFSCKQGSAAARTSSRTLSPVFKRLARLAPPETGYKHVCLLMMLGNT